MPLAAPRFRPALLDPKLHDRAAFACGEPSLDTYLKRQASQDAKRDVAKTYVLSPTDDPASIVGYYTLSSFAMLLGELPEQVLRRLPRYERIPAVLVGRLARDQRFRGTGLGELLLMHALEQALRVSEQVGAHAVVVDALNDHAAAFYQRFGFIALEDDPRRLYLLMADVRTLFSH